MPRFRKVSRAGLTYAAAGAVTIVLDRALSAHHVVLLACVGVVITGAVANRAWKVRRGGVPVRDLLRASRQRARGRVDSAEKLRGAAPHAVGLAALASFPAAILAAVAAPRAAKGVDLPPVTDARWQLYCIAVIVVVTVLALDYWLGFGTCVRALVGDAFSSAALAFTISLAAASPMLVFWHVESRPAWLSLLAVQFVWPFAGAILMALVLSRRKRRFLATRPPGEAGPAA